MAKAPVALALAKRVEAGGVLSCSGVCASAQPFLAALLARLFPQHTLVVVAADLKTQELFQQDLETWLGLAPLYFPPWEVLPHEGKLPPVDVVSDRLQTLMQLSAPKPKRSLLVTSVTALMQRTFAAAEIQKRTQRLKRGDTIDPLDLIEALEAQGYEPEAQVSQKGEIALRGGILDIFPPTGAWPVRLEFFGNELESLREVDPATQISRAEIESVALPPAGELGILKGLKAGDAPPASLLDYLPAETVFVLCEPELIAARAEDYSGLIPKGDALLVDWAEFREQVRQRGGALVELTDEGEEGTAGVEEFSPDGKMIRPPSPRPSPPDPAERDWVEEWSADLWRGDDVGGGVELPDARARPAAPGAGAVPMASQLTFASLDAYRPLSERAPDPQIAEANRREFFGQVHRWLRQKYDVRIFCNNDGERQRFLVIAPTPCCWVRALAIRRRW